MRQDVVDTTAVEPAIAPPLDRRLVTGRRALAAAATLAFALGLAACGSDSKDDATPTTLDATSATTAAGASTTEAGGSGGGGGGGGGGRRRLKPVIDSFDTPEDIDCHNGNLQNFTASWTTSDATRVTISIDGAGIYDEYPADGDTSLPFNCSTSHTFLLTAYSSDGASTTPLGDPAAPERPGQHDHHHGSGHHHHDLT